MSGSAFAGEGITFCFVTSVCTAADHINGRGRTSALIVIGTFLSFTVDVDFFLRQMPNTPEQLRVVLEEIIATPTENEFVTFEITDVAPIAVAKKYAGIGASLVAHIKNTRTPFSIDFGVGDVIVPKQEK